MKTKLHHFRFLTAVIIALFICSSVYSQKVISSVNVQKSIETVSKHLNTNSDDIILEPIKTENWMQNKNYLESYSSLENYKMQLMMNEKVEENERSIESWMLNKKDWEIINPEPSETVDQTREIEPWMLDCSFWKIKDEPDRIEIEDWMLDNKFWVMVK